MTESRAWKVTVGLAAAAVLAATLPSTPRWAVVSWDTQAKMEVARNFWHGKGPVLDGPTTRRGATYSFEGVHGRCVSCYPILSCLAQLPTYWLRRLGAPVLAGLPMLLLLAGLAAVITAWGRRAGVDPVSSLAAAMAVCLGTTLWPVSTHSYDNTAEAFGLALLLWAGTGPARLRDWLAAGFGLGAMFCIRQPAAFLALPALVLIVLQEPRNRKSIAHRGLLLAAGVAPWIGVSIAYDLYRFGVPFWAPDMTRPITSPFFSGDHFLGMAGLTVSFGKGLLWYSPLMIAALAMARPCLRSWRPQALALAAWMAMELFFHGRLTFWHGEWTWSPRYVASFAVAIAPATWVACRWARSPASRAETWRWVLLGSLTFIAILYQGLAISPQPVLTHLEKVVNPLYREGKIRGEFMANLPHPDDWGPLYFTLRNSPLLAQARAAFETLAWSDWILLLCAPAAALGALLLARRLFARPPPAPEPTPAASHP